MLANFGKNNKIIELPFSGITTRGALPSPNDLQNCSCEKLKLWGKLGGVKNVSNNNKICFFEVIVFLQKLSQNVKNAVLEMLEIQNLFREEWLQHTPGIIGTCVHNVCLQRSNG